MERFIQTQKLELGSISQLKVLGELNEVLAMAMHYYNTKRIHLALKTTPAAYAVELKSRDNLFAKKVAWRNAYFGIFTWLLIVALDSSRNKVKV